MEKQRLSLRDYTRILVITSGGYEPPDPHGSCGSSEGVAQLDLPPVTVSGDADGDVDLFDVAAYFDCVTGPGGGVPPDCVTFDFDADDDVDFFDHGAFQLAYTGP